MLLLVFFFAFDLTISDTTLLGLGAKTIWVSSGKHLLFWIKYKLFSSSNNWPPWLHILGYHGNVQHWQHPTRLTSDALHLLQTFRK